MMKLLVSTHQGKLYDEELDYVVVHTEDNEFALMKDHIPLVCVIQYGYIKMVRDSDVFFVAITNGVLEYKYNVITVIAQEAHIGKNEESARAHLNELRAERLELNRKESADFTKQETDLLENLKNAKAGRL
ncbi:MAG: F0F1 ATP synthase subunit epsilon [Anaeroplasmataceae bacterium]